MKWLNRTVLLLYLLYFVSLLTGSPAIVESTDQPAIPDNPEAYPYSRLEETLRPLTEPGDSGPDESQEADSENPLRFSESELLTEPVQDVEWSIGWQPGLIEYVSVERTMLRMFHDPMLDSDGTPEQLLRSLERSLTSDIASLILTIFWCVVLALNLAALHRRLWFYKPMSNITIGFSMLAFITILMATRRSAFALGTEMTDQLVRAGIELLLFLAGSAVLMQRVLPSYGPEHEHNESFLDHMRDLEHRLPVRVRNAIRSAWQVSLVALAGVALANLILLPVYKLQLSFPGFFGFLLIAGILVLSYFYIRAYRNVARSQKQEAGLVSGLAFLGFRLLRNTLFITTLLMVIGLVMTLIVWITVQNTSVLEVIGILPTPEAL
ncbi:MAG: hypothetical protein KDK27_03955 [Leptospiraceae bacterium]|nr:hypothetical protein [Leptospiraceae bacterium]